MTRAILDFPDPTGAVRRLIFAEPLRIITATTHAGIRPALREVEDLARAGGWAVGCLAYEAAPAFDRALTTRPPVPDMPLLWFGIFDAPQVAEHGARHVAERGAPDVAKHGARHVAERGAPDVAKHGARHVAERGAPDVADGRDSVAASASSAPAPLHWNTATPRRTFDDAIATIRESIAAGDVYQVNHTLRFGARFDADPVTLYDSLVAARHGLYHAFIETADWAVVSASPELFLDIRDGAVTTRPMKGTMRRGRWLGEDRDAAQRLAASVKDRAENLMIVDLLRNDLGRIAEFGSVSVPRLFDIETYPTVFQMTSTITARLRNGIRLDDIFAATFPCGSVTGAPKVTAMRTIAALEDSSRGVYCGAIGVVRPDGSATFNVPIRTLLLDRRNRTATYGAGGGITWDSHADAEYDEVVAKAALLTESIPEFDLIETLRLDDGIFARLPLHLQRLDESARYWGFHAATAREAAAMLESLRGELPAGHWRVRLLARRDGSTHVTYSPLSEVEGALRRAAPGGALPVALADEPVSRRDRLLCHKTTARSSYDKARAACPDAFDVLLQNEHHRITEFTLGNVVADLDGHLVTPPRDDGLLAGTMRAQLLDDGTIHEAAITRADLHRARGLWLINSVRGWVPVTLVATPPGEKGRAS
jgi:para-aminobenzoate synthetase / 4-amino-4-deoxychorismate lyase